MRNGDYDNKWWLRTTWWWRWYWSVFKKTFCHFLKMSFWFFFHVGKSKANERRNVERTRLLIRFIDETGKNEIVLFWKVRLSIYFSENFSLFRVWFFSKMIHTILKWRKQTNPKSKISYFCDPMKGFFNCKYNSTSNICNIHFQTFWTARFACAGAGTVSLSNNILGDSICFRQTCLKVVNGHLVIK